MRPLAERPAARWAAPVAALAVVVAAPFAVNTVVGAQGGLEPRTAQQLLVDLQSHERRPMQGEVRQTVDLGLPSVPGGGGQVGTEATLGNVLALASGTHTWRVWTDGGQATRLALVDGSSETVWVHNGTESWMWSSAERTAVRLTGQAGSGSHGAPGAPAAGPPGAPATTTVPRSPDEAAAQVLKALDPTTEVTTDGTDRVAGRPVHQLVLTPKQPETKVGRVRVAVDPETKQALRVQVFSKSGQAAVDVGFTSITYAAPDPAVFQFTPPPGTTVTEKNMAQPGATDPAAAKSAKADKAARGERPTGSSSVPDDQKPKVQGEGWSTVVVTKMPKPTASAAPAPSTTTARRGAHGRPANTANDATAILQSLPEVSGPWGKGRLLDGPLVSAIITDDGRVAVGAVTVDALQRALSQ